MEQRRTIKDIEGPFNQWWVPKTVEYKNGYLTFEGARKYYSIEKRYKDYIASKKDDERFRPPYVSLHETYRQLGNFEAGLMDAIREFENSKDSTIFDKLYKNKVLHPIIDWAKKFGPLGIMLHECSNIVQTAVAIDTETSNAFHTPVDFWRPDEGWQRVWLEDDEPNQKKNIFDGIQADISTIGDEYDSEKYAVQCFETHREIIKLYDYFENYFDPKKPFSDNKTLPIPLSQDFISCYREPIAYFIQGAGFLCTAIDMVLSDNDEFVQQGRKELLQLSSSVRFIPTEGYRGGQYRMTFQAPSMISGLATWAYLDTIRIGPNDQTKAFYCHKCGKLHASAITRMKFCSVKCKHTYTKRKQRR
jgi:hypothetical protein